jgi:hypothetical protein
MKNTKSTINSSWNALKSDICKITVWLLISEVITNSTPPGCTYK